MTRPVEAEANPQQEEEGNDGDVEKTETITTKEVIDTELQKSGASGTDVTADSEIVTDSNVPVCSHMKNETHPVWLRYGIPVYLVGTIVMLLNADIGSGVQADYLLYQGETLVEQRSLLVVTIFSSVQELWSSGSYPLAILIAVTSVAWPYIKLLLALYAWVMPNTTPRRRENLLIVLEAIGKWSFVDIIVLVEILVAFRATIKLSPVVVLQLVIVPKWGFYGFVLATMLSLLSTHVILHYHRKVMYHAQHDKVEEGQEETVNDKTNVARENRSGTKGFATMAGLSNNVSAASMITLLVGFALYLTGCLMDIYEVTNTRGTSVFVDHFSISSIGNDIPSSSLDDSNAGIRFIQTMWFLLCIALPLLCSCLWGLLYLVPNLSANIRHVLFVMGEISFAWSCAEVMLVSTIFSVYQLPVFAEGLVESDCQFCFVVESELLPKFPIIAFGTVLNVFANLWLYQKAHKAIFKPDV